MSFGDDISGAFSRSERRGDGHVITDMSENTVDGRVDTESFTDNRVQDRELTKFFIGHGTKRPIGAAEILHLFLINGITVTLSE